MLQKFYFQNKMATFKDDQCVQRVGNESHLSRLSSGLNQLRQQASFCDVNIIVGDQRFSAHKAVLSSTSDYFQCMFSSGFQESTLSEVTVPGTEEGFAQILDFAYTGYFTLSSQTVTDILRMACYMVFTEAMELCADYLRRFKENLTIEDCFEIWLIASNHIGLLDTAQLFRSHLLQNFLKLVKSRSFLEDSSASVMMGFLSDEKIETDGITEEQILQAALSWLKYDWDQRKVHAVDLLKKVRLGLVPLNRLKEICDDELFTIPECKDMAEEVARLSVTKDTASPPLTKSHPELFATRNTITAKLREDDGHGWSVSEPIVSLISKTELGCYKMTELADIPNRYPYLDDRDPSVQPFVSDKNQLYAVVDVAYTNLTVHVLDREDEDNHDKWLSENNFFQYLAEKNEWIVLPTAPKRMQWNSEIFQLEGYMYSIGNTVNYSHVVGNTVNHSYGVIQRFSTLSKSWEILVSDMLFFVHTATLLSTGQILIKGVQYRAGPNLNPQYHNGCQVEVVALYKPATNELLDVSVDSEVYRLSFFVEHDNNCYMVTRMPDLYTRQINRVICNFDSDEPSMVISGVVEEETLDPRIMQFDPEFTFDKRKLGLVRVRCRCESHLWRLL